MGEAGISGIEIEILESNIYYYKNAIPDSNNIISLLEEIDKNILDDSNMVISKWSKWTASRSEREFLFGYRKTVRYDLMNNNILPFNTEMTNIINTIESSIKTVSEDYSKKNNFFIGSLAPICISKYIEGAHMGQHTDSYDNDEKPTISVVAYLNDNYSGGEINFPNQNICIKPLAGSIIVFPSKFPYVHESKAIISGKKYISPGFWSLNM